MKKTVEFVSVAICVRSYCLNTVLSVQIGALEKGDVVRMSEDLEDVKRKQRGHGGWNDEMRAVSFKFI